MTEILDSKRILRAQYSPLIAEAAEGNSRAVSAILESARTLVYEWATSRTRDPDDAEDITQRVLLKLYSRLSAFRGESRLSSWLYRITVNEISDHHRRRVREKAKARVWMDSNSQLSNKRSSLDQIDNARAARAVKAAATDLPPLQQAAFRLVDLGGMRPCDAARELGKTQTTLRSTLCRARKKIRGLVEGCRNELRGKETS